MPASPEFVSEAPTAGFPIVRQRQGSPLRGSTYGPDASPSSGDCVASPRRSGAVTQARKSGRILGAPGSPDMLSGKARLAFAIAMRVYEASLSYNLVQLGDDVSLNSAAKVVEYLRSGFESTPLQETFWVILLNRKNNALGRIKITTGTATATLTHPREVFRPAILANASAIIVAHNHPSGDPTPSSPDKQITRQLREAAKAVDIELLDHVVVGYPESDPLRLGYFSFREAGML